MPNVSGVRAAHRRALSVDFLDVQELSINSTPVETTTLIVAPSDVADLNGEKLVIDADADTYLRQTGGPSGTDDSVDVFVAGALDFQITANTFKSLSGSKITTNTIDETTAASGVTVDGVLLKDGGAVFADAATIEVDTINEATSAAGVTIDGVLIKDGNVNAGRQVQSLTASGAITIKSGLVVLNHATVAIAATLAAPVAGADLVIVDGSASGTAAHTVTLPAGVTFNVTGNNTATLNAPDEALHIVAQSATQWRIVSNAGAVALSTVP